MMTDILNYYEPWKAECLPVLHKHKIMRKNNDSFLHTFMDWYDVRMIQFRLDVNFSLNMVLFPSAVQALFSYHLHRILQRGTDNKHICSEQKFKSW